MVPIHNVSETLKTLFDKKTETDADELTIGEILHMMHDLGFGMVLMLFSLPIIIPGLPPPIPSILAIPLGFTGWQMLCGFKELKLPLFVANRRLKRSSLQKVILLSTRYLRFAERYAKPRFLFLTSPLGERIIGVLVMVFFVVIAIPAPFAHSVPALAVSIIGIAVIKKDGLAGLIGIAVGIAWIFTLVFLSKELFAFIGGLFG